MSAIALDPRPAARPAARPGLARLTAVELRKLVDTRAGLWLQIATVALSLAVAALTAFTGGADDHTLSNILSGAIAPAGLLLPIMGILLVTSEWTQRTSLITFALVPQRSRVIAAKLLASAVLSLAALVVGLAIAVAMTPFASDHAWSLPLGLLGQDALSLVTAMVTGVAFGALLLASAPAIVLYFVLPIALGAIASISFLVDPTIWIDISRSYAPLTERLMSATEWAHAGTSLLLWMVVPLAAGLWRVSRDEVR